MIAPAAFATCLRSIAAALETLAEDLEKTIPADPRAIPQPLEGYFLAPVAVAAYGRLIEAGATVSRARDPELPFGRSKVTLSVPHTAWRTGYKNAADLQKDIELLLPYGIGVVFP